MPSEPSSSLTEGSFTSLAAGTDPLRTLLPLPFSLEALLGALGEGPGDSAAPSVSSFCLLGLREFLG